MRNLSYSFMPNGKYFVFDVDTGETVKKNLNDLAAAKSLWISARGWTSKEEGK